MDIKPESAAIKNKLSDIEKAQKKYFASNATRPLSSRKEHLKSLLSCIKKNEKRIIEALHADLQKPEIEAYLSEVGFMYQDIKHVLKHLSEWVQPEEVQTPSILIPLSSSSIVKQPYGRALIIGPWNYPFMLLMSPLVGSIAAGNCTVLKPSELSENTSALVEELISGIFDQSFVAVVNGGVEVSTALLDRKFDTIFFTGSTQVGKIVAQAAAKNLTPVTLELGGKSPCIVHSDANIKLATKKIIWGKFFNAGQSCTAPDYILVHENVREKLIAEMGNEIERAYKGSAQGSDFARIINEKHFDRLTGLMQGLNIVFGGGSDRGDLFIEPTIIDGVLLSDAIMQEEIFGPLLPVIGYSSIETAKAYIKELENPLALYLFTADKNLEKEIINEVSFGGGCINNTMTHIANHELPFGGVGSSGIGSYHGKFSFDAFSHSKGIIKSNRTVDLAVQYAPYKKKLPLVKMFVR